MVGRILWWTVRTYSHTGRSCSSGDASVLLVIYWTRGVGYGSLLMSCALT